MTEHEIDRSLIDAAREGLAPTSGDRARLRGAVMAAVAGGAAAGTAGVAAGASAAAKGAGALGVWTAGKIVLGLAATIAVVAAGTWAAAGRGAGDGASDAAARDEASAPTVATARPMPAAPEPSPAEAPSEPADDPAGRDGAEAASPAGALAAEPATTPARSRGATRRAATETASGIAPASEAAAPTTETLVGETALLREAHRALQAGDAARALAELDAHAARFPRGALAEERLATRVLALCAAGRESEARAAADRFVAEHPRSPHVTRVRASCEER